MLLNKYYYSSYINDFTKPQRTFDNFFSFKKYCIRISQTIHLYCLSQYQKYLTLYVKYSHCRPL